jgi:hypothetical protein
MHEPMWIIQLFNVPISGIKCFVPSPNYLSDIAAFEAVIIALAVPLGFEIVSRFSDRFSSEVVAKRFSNEWELKWLPWLLIPNIILAVTLRFFVGDETTSCLWNVIAWIVFFGFILVALMLAFFIRRLRKYTTDTEYILGRLYDDAKRSLKK